MELSERAVRVHQKLLEHYGQPEWRNPLPPVAELVSTILSQNTNDTNRDRAFESLRERFANWEEVREADPQEVIEAIQTAGLANQKGPSIQNALRKISEARGDLSLEFLREMSVDDAGQWLMQLKGVGPKTAAIILLFSLDMPAFPVDTHIYRVTGRIGLRPKGINAEKAHEHLGDLFPPEAYYAAHLNLIRLGRNICVARRPRCPDCPLQDLCDYYAENYPGARLT